MLIQNLDIEQRLRIGNAATEYYSLAVDCPAQQVYEMWLESLKEPTKSECKRLGLENCKAKLNFKRFYLELHDIGMDEFMRKQLSKKDYGFWKRNHLFEK